MGKIVYINSKGQSEDPLTMDASHLYNAVRKSERENDPQLPILKAILSIILDKEKVHVKTKYHSNNNENDYLDIPPT